MLLLLNPVATALGQILTRMINRLHETVISFYANLSQTLIIPVIVYGLEGSAFESPWGFQWWEWALVLVIGHGAWLSQIF